MKERYESPVAELVEVACEDVILASLPSFESDPEEDWGDE